MSLGQHWIIFWTQKQTLAAVASSGSELHAGVEALAETLAAQSMSQGFGMLMFPMHLPSNLSADLAMSDAWTRIT